MELLSAAARPVVAVHAGADRRLLDELARNFLVRDLRFEHAQPGATPVIASSCEASSPCSSSSSLALEREQHPSQSNNIGGEGITTRMERLSAIMFYTPAVFVVLVDDITQLSSAVVGGIAKLATDRPRQLLCVVSGDASAAAQPRSALQRLGLQSRRLSSLATELLRLVPHLPAASILDQPTSAQAVVDAVKTMVPSYYADQASNIGRPFPNNATEECARLVTRGLCELLSGSSRAALSSFNSAYASIVEAVVPERRRSSMSTLAVPDLSLAARILADARPLCDFAAMRIAAELLNRGAKGDADDYLRGHVVWYTAQAKALYPRLGMRNPSQHLSEKSNVNGFGSTLPHDQLSLHMSSVSCKPLDQGSAVHKSLIDEIAQWRSELYAAMAAILARDTNARRAGDFCTQAYYLFHASRGSASAPMLAQAHALFAESGETHQAAVAALRLMALGVRRTLDARVLAAWPGLRRAASDACGPMLPKQRAALLWAGLVDCEDPAVLEAFEDRFVTALTDAGAVKVSGSGSMSGPCVVDTVTSPDHSSCKESERQDHPLASDSTVSQTNGFCTNASHNETPVVEAMFDFTFGMSNATAMEMSSPPTFALNSDSVRRASASSVMSTGPVVLHEHAAFGPVAAAAKLCAQNGHIYVAASVSNATPAVLVVTCVSAVYEHLDVDGGALKSLTASSDSIEASRTPESQRRIEWPCNVELLPGACESVEFGGVDDGEAFVLRKIVLDMLIADVPFSVSIPSAALVTLDDDLSCALHARLCALVVRGMYARAAHVAVMHWDSVSARVVRWEASDVFLEPLRSQSCRAESAADLLVAVLHVTFDYACVAEYRILCDGTDLQAGSIQAGEDGRAEVRVPGGCVAPHCVLEATFGDATVACPIEIAQAFADLPAALQCTDGNPIKHQTPIPQPGFEIETNANGNDSLAADAARDIDAAHSNTTTPFDHTIPPQHVSPVFSAQKADIVSITTPALLAHAIRIPVADGHLRNWVLWNTSPAPVALLVRVSTECGLWHGPRQMRLVLGALEGRLLFAGNALHLFPGETSAALDVRHGDGSPAHLYSV